MQFTKMQGLGNSYVFFNLLEDSMGNVDFSELARQVSNVNFGIGSDGIILIGPSEQADFRMRIFNKDGSEAKNCGNGLRCAAKYLYDNMYADSPNFTIETLGGVVRLKVELEEKRIVRNVMVDMGEPKLLKMMIPMQGIPSSSAINEPVTIDNVVYHMTCVSMGNPHAIMFVDDVNKVPLEEIGPKIEYSPTFPERVNVGIVQIINRQEVHYRVWERGSGITMACGTGACASVVAATLNNLLERFIPITVHLPGGNLTVTWDDNNHVWKRGEAKYVCYGELEKNNLLKNQDISN